MAEHIWMIPVAGAGERSDMPQGPQRDTINVQWAFDKYPTSILDVPCLEVLARPGFTIPSQQGQAKLTTCCAQWLWWSCRDCEDPPNAIIGGQLAVGTVFSRQPLGTAFNRVDVRAKFMATQNMFSNVQISINDMSGNVSAGGGIAPTGGWQLASHFKAGGWDGWDDDNLRVVMTFQGTTNAANVGKTSVWMEWFAIGLT